MDKLEKIKNSDALIKRLRIFRNFVIVLIAALLIIVVASGYVLAKKINSDKESQLPSAELSQSIFEQQNNDAVTPNGGYVEYYLFENHYSYDVSDSRQAFMGSTYFYSFDDTDSIVSVSEIRDNNMESAINLLSTDLNAGFSVGELKLLDKQQGYRNSWETNCLFMKAGNKNIVTYLAKVEEGIFAVTSFGEDGYENLVNYCLDVFDTFKVSNEWISEHETTTEETENIEPESDIEHLE